MRGDLWVVDVEARMISIKRSDYQWEQRFALASMERRTDNSTVADESGLEGESIWITMRIEPKASGRGS